jgi:hypothetical protein
MTQERPRSPSSLILAGMEVCWLYTALLLMVRKSGSEGLSPALLLSFYPVSWGFARFLSQQAWPRVGRLLASAAGWILCTLVFGQWLLLSTSDFFHVSGLTVFASALTHLPSFPNQEQLFVVSGGLIWWLGRRLAGLPPTFSTLISEFQFGTAMLLILFFMASQWEMNLPGLVLVCLTFFAFSFLGISLAHAREGKGWLQGAHRNQWLSILLFAICLAFALGLFMSAVIRPELLKILLNFLKLLWHLLAELVRMIITFLVSLLPKTDPGSMPPLGPPVVPGEPPSWVKLLRLPEWVRPVGQIVVSSLWLILILAALWSLSSQIIHWLRHKLDHDEGASYEPISGAFREDLMHLLRMIWNRVSRLIRFFRRNRVGHDSISREAESVRQIYRHLLDWAASAGCPRGAAQTPGEYLLALTRWFPEGRLELSLITEQYVVVRYSPFLPTRDVLENMVKTWDRLKNMKVQKRKKPE